MPGSTFFSPRLLRTLVIAMGTPVALVAALAVTASASVAAAAARPRSCQTAGLVIWLNTFPNGAAGSTYYTLEFTNLSGRACTLRGYPGVSAIGLHGRRLGDAASRDNLRKPRTIRLSQGDTATTTLRIVQAGDFPNSRCHMVNAAGLRVFPPDQTASRTIPYPFPACSRKGVNYLGVLAVRAGNFPLG